MQLEHHFLIKIKILVIIFYVMQPDDVVCKLPVFNSCLKYKRLS